MSEKRYQHPFDASANASRWNPRGARMIYAASDPALAQLEYLCIRGNSVARAAWLMVIFEITDHTLAGTLEPDSLPADWLAVPHSKTTQDFGKLWLAERESPFLKVPSARLHLSFYPTQFNMLINPDYPGLRTLLNVKDTVPFHFSVNQ